MGLGERSIRRLAAVTEKMKQEDAVVDITLEAKTEAKQDSESKQNEKKASGQSKKKSDKDDFKYTHLAGLAGHIISPALNKASGGGNVGWLGYQKPYITIINKRPVGTEDLNKYVGLPAEIKVALNTLSGYTEISDIFFPQNSNQGMTKIEEEEIKTLLNDGVII